MVTVRVRVISDYDVTLNMSTAARIKLQSEKCFFYPPLFRFLSAGDLSIGTHVPIFSSTDAFARTATCHRNTNESEHIFHITSHDDVKYWIVR